VFFLLAALLAAPAVRGTSVSITTLAEDTVTNGNCTLREALLAAADSAPQDACPGDLEADTIELALVGTYLMNDGDILLAAGRTLTVRGASGQPAGAYVIDLDASQRFLDVGPGASLTLENLTLMNGLAASGNGGALRVQDSDLTLRDVRVINGHATAGGGISFYTETEHHLDVESAYFADNVANGDQAYGGALEVDLQESASARIVNSQFVGNKIESATGSFSRSGGGLSVRSTGGGAIELRHLLALSNTIDAPSFADGGGIWLRLSETASLDLEDVDVGENQLLVDAGSNGSSGIEIYLFDTPATLRRLRVVHNPGSSSKRQLQLTVEGSSDVVVSDVLIARGSAQGGALFSFGSGCSLLAGNFTVTDHPDSGLVVNSEASCPLRLENSIVTGNATSTGSDLEAYGDTEVSSENLVGGDAGFVDAIGGDYHLGALSAAAEAGDATFLSVGPFDADHGPRQVGSQLDLGAFERGAIFAEDFERADLFPWSSTTGAP
jgi:hypothetical protein